MKQILYLTTLYTVLSKEIQRTLLQRFDLPAAVSLNAPVNLRKVERYFAM